MQRQPLHFCDILRSVTALRRRVLSVGRLDVNTSGLLLLTNCGHLKQVSRIACTMMRSMLRVCTRSRLWRRLWSSRTATSTGEAATARSCRLLPL